MNVGWGNNEVKNLVQDQGVPRVEIKNLSAFPGQLKIIGKKRTDVILHRRQFISKLTSFECYDKGLFLGPDINFVSSVGEFSSIGGGGGQINKGDFCKDCPQQPISP